MHLVSPSCEQRLSIIFPEAGDLEKRVYQDDELPPPKSRGSENDTSSQPPPPPLKRWPERDTGVAALLGSGDGGERADRRARPTWPRPGEGRLLADKGVKEEVRDATLGG